MPTSKLVTIFRTLRSHASRLLLMVILSACSSYGYAQTATKLIREGEVLPGDSSGEVVLDVRAVTVNQSGGFSFGVSTDNSTDFGNDKVWGSAIMGTGSVLVSEGTFGNLTQTSFRQQSGLANDGSVAYAARVINSSNSTTNQDSIWIGSTPLLVEGDSIPNLPGTSLTFANSVGISASGIPNWRGRYTDNSGVENAAIFSGTSIVIKGGDSIGAVSDLLSVASNNLQRPTFSSSSTNYLVGGRLDSTTGTDTVIIINGNALTTGGSVVREGSSIPGSIGGLAGETYQDFAFGTSTPRAPSGINENGDYLLSAQGNDLLVIMNGDIVVRAGDIIDGRTITGAWAGGTINNNGDWAIIFGDDLIVNGGVVLSVGDLVDWTGDGIIDASDQGNVLEEFRSISMGDPFNGILDLYLAADVRDASNSRISAGLKMSVAAVPEPGSLPLLAILLLSLVRSRVRQDS